MSARKCMMIVTVTWMSLSATEFLASFLTVCYFAILFYGPFIGVCPPFYTSRAPSVSIIGYSFLRRTSDMPQRGHSVMRYVVLCLLTLSSDIRVSVRFLLHVCFNMHFSFCRVYSSFFISHSSFVSVHSFFFLLHSSVSLLHSFFCIIASFFIIFSSFLLLPASVCLLHSSVFCLHSSLFILHVSFFLLPYSCFLLHASCLMRPSPFIPHSLFILL